MVGWKRSGTRRVDKTCSLILSSVRVLSMRLGAMRRPGLGANVAALREVKVRNQSDEEEMRTRNADTDTDTSSSPLVEEKGSDRVLAALAHSPQLLVREPMHPRTLR